MFHRHGRALIAAVSATLVASAVYAADTTSEDARIQQLQAKVAQLEAKEAQNSKDVAATINSVLRDAEHRSQLLAMSGDASAGYDNGFFIRGGDWLIRPGMLFQFRNVSDYRENTPGSNDDEIENGFEIRRLKPSLEGTAFMHELSYYFQWSTGSDTGSLGLDDAWVKYMFADQWGARLGQFKEAYSHEWSVADGRQLAVERSLVDSFLGQGMVGRTQGVSLIYGDHDKANPLYAEAGLTDGANQLNTDYVGRVGHDGAPFNGPHFYDFGVFGRAEYKVMGDWRDYADFTAKNTKQDLLVLGAGVDWSQAGDGDQIGGTIDAQYESTSGLGIYGAILYRYLNTDLLGDDTHDWGALVQVGYLLNPSWEVFGRWDFVKFDNTVAFAPGNDEDWFNELSIGVNYFLGADGSALHRAKFTVDLNYLPDGSPASRTGLGYLGDNAGNNEWVVRAQFQLWL